MIESHGLTKRLGGRTIVSDVTFTCRPGTVTGFLGPNGAGKTTTMRMLCGLSDPDGGHAEILNLPYRKIPNPGRRVGILLDASAQHAGRRGEEVLTLSALTIGADPAVVPELLDRVGLPKRAARQRLKAYSLGMRQRLGIAAALVGDPEVLILDEPANGLDPEGMRWMRGLLRDFADRGGTVLLSSHLLHEVEAVADQLVIIGNGKIVAAGTREELLAGSGTLVRAAADHGDDRLGRALGDAGLTVRAHPDGGFIVEAEPDDVGRAALAGGVALSRLGPSESAGLEQLFFDLTSSARPTRPLRPPPTCRRPPDERHHDDPRAASGRDSRPGLRPPDPGRAAQDARHARGLLAAADRGAAGRPGRGAETILTGSDSGRNFSNALDNSDPGHQLPRADRGHPARHVGVVAAHRADDVHARAQARPRADRQDRAPADPARARRVHRDHRPLGRLHRDRRQGVRRHGASAPGRSTAASSPRSRCSTVISMLIGVGLGAAILLSAPAIVAAFVLPIAYSAVTNIVGALHGLRRLDRPERDVRAA